MTPTAEPFAQAGNDWDLQRLYRDFASAKEKFSGKRKQLTPLEMACLRGLLCRSGPNEIAAELNREVRGLRVDLSRGLYRYVEILTERPLNTLKDWRDVADWLEKANYKTRFNHNDSLIKIVDVTLDGSFQLPVIDIKVRNIGSQVAFLKKARFKFYKAWVIRSLVFRDVEVFKHPVCYKLVPPSFHYEVPSKVYMKDFLHGIPQFDLDSPPYLEEFNISQCVPSNDVDRFTFKLYFPQEQLESDTNTYNSNIYNLNLEIVYDEDNKTVQSPNLFLGVASAEYSFFEEDYVEILRRNKKYIQEMKNAIWRDDKDRLLYVAKREEDYLGQILQIKKSIQDIKEYSQHNKEVLLEVAKIEGIKSPKLNQLLDRYSKFQPIKKLFNRFYQWQPTKKQTNRSVLERLLE